MNDKQLEEKAIKRYQDLEQMLDRVEGDDKNYLTGDLKKLRDRILYAHIRSEANIDALISREVLNFNRVVPDALDAAMAIIKVYKVLNKVFYKDKIVAAKNLSAISKDTFKKLDKLNDLRNAFTHPNINELKTKYKESSARIYAINIVINALLGVINEFKTNK